MDLKEVLEYKAHAEDQVIYLAKKYAMEKTVNYTRRFRSKKRKNRSEYKKENR